MNSIEIAFEHPWLLLLFIPAAALILLPFLLMLRKRRCTVKRLIPVILHLLLALVLVLILSGFSVIRQVNDQAVILLMDLSESTGSVKDRMQAHGEELMRMIDETVPVGVVAFGEKQVYCVRLDEKERTVHLEKPAAEATNLEEALMYTASLAPSDKALRIVLFTDGKQTDGNAQRAAYELAGRGIRLDAVYYDTTGRPTKEVQISSFRGPQGVYRGREATLSAELTSNTDCQAVLRLYENDTLLMTQPYAVKAGSNLMEMTIVPQSAGVFTYRLEMQVKEDTVSKNNEAYACLSVAGKPSVLIIADTMKNAQALEQVLAEENDVTSTTAYSAPATIAQLCKYDAVVLSNVHYYALPGQYEKILQEYVGGYGRTLLAVGGRETFMYGSMQDTFLQDMLPVTLSLEESANGNSVALMLVLDCSSSMNGERVVIAKQGAIKCLEAMSDNDYVGVVSFSKTANLDSPLLRADGNNKEALTRTISALELGRGTYYTEALQLAKEELAKSDANIKHILFLSDGQPSDDGYYDVAEEASMQGMTVSTIGFGYSSYILSGIASYGNGRYYYVNSADELPDIMLSETEQAKVSSLIVKDFVPVIKEEGPLTEELENVSLAPLGGYLGTTLKEEATAYLATEEGHPIYAEWKYGFGRVACFTSDLSGIWSDRWLVDPVGRELTHRMIKTTIPAVHSVSSLVSEIETNGKNAKIAVKTAASSSGNAVSVTLMNGEEGEPYTLAQVYPGRFEGIIPLGKPGGYELHVVETAADGTMVDELYTTAAVSYPIEYDAFSKSSEQLLYSLCDLANGQVFSDLSALAKVETPGIRMVYDPVIPLAVLLALWLLLDIAVRKISLKDLKSYYLKAREKFRSK